ncbi:MAG: hypothetical protein AAF636_21130 [Pseudomonadota bacterium]
MARHAFVILTHVFTPRIRALVARTKADLEPDYDVWVIGAFQDDVDPPAEFNAGDSRVRALFSEDLAPLHYPAKGKRGRMRGDNDLQVLWFARQYPDYETIWLIEGDVDFTGGLDELVGHFDASPADLLTTNVRLPRPDWGNAHRTHLQGDWPTDIVPDVPIALLAVFRANRAFLHEIERFYTEGCDGHSEWTWPYVTLARELCLEDLKDYPINGHPIYTSSPAVPGLFPGSFRFRPAISAPGRRPATLWHPVKDRPVTTGEYTSQILRAGWQMTRNLFSSGRKF